MAIVLVEVGVGSERCLLHFVTKMFASFCDDDVCQDFENVGTRHCM